MGYIYTIKNEKSNKLYVGKAIDFERRKKRHLNHLKQNKHCNYDLQKDYNNGDNLIFGTLKEYDNSMLYQMEKFWIKKLNTFNGFGYNKSEGGDGFETGENHYAYKDKLFTFYHKNGTVEENITQYNMQIKYNLDQSHISAVCLGKEKRINGWALTKEDAKTAKICYRGKRYTFYNIDGKIDENMTVTEMSKKYNLDSSYFSRLTLKKIDISHGWVIDINNFPKKYTFYHIDGKIERNITISEMKNKYNYLKSCIFAIINNRRKTVYGWAIEKEHIDKKINK